MQGPDLARRFHVAPQPQPLTATFFSCYHGNTFAHLAFTKVNNHSFAII